jgi:glycogen synthase
MKVLHVHGPHVPDLTEGISRNVASLVAASRRQGHDARLAAACRHLGDLNRRSILLSGTVRARRLARLSEGAFRPAALHAHVSVAGLAALALLRRTRVPVVAHVWNAVADSATPAGRGRLLQRVANGPRLAGLALRGADAVVVGSRHQADQLARASVDVPVHVVPSGVDAQRFRPPSWEERLRARRLLGLPAGPVILYYGHLSPWKGWRTLVAALPRILRERPDATALFSVTAYGGAAGSLRSALARSGIARRCAVLGPEEVGTLHAAASVAVLPLHAAVGTACPPNVLLESMAAGLPVVATRVGAVPEVLRDSRDGLLVPPADPDALADAVGRLLADDGLSLRLGLAARRRALDFPWHAAAASLARIHAGLAPRAPTGDVPVPTGVPA